MSIRVRNWVFTWNNYPEDWEKQLQAVPHIKYYLGGEEVAPNTGTKHIQGWANFSEKMSLKMLKVLESVHWEAMKGEVGDSEAYCSKSGGVLHRWGKMPAGKGSRTDVAEIKELVKSGGNMRDVIEVATSYQSIRMAEMLLKYQRGRDWLPEVWWLWGKPGAGKSRKARELLSDSPVYVKNTGDKWWEGYDGEANVIIDDFRDSWWPLTYLLGLIDRYEFRVEYKGGSRQFLGKKIVITSVLMPDFIYAEAKGIEDVRGQIMRRLAHVVEVQAGA